METISKAPARNTVKAITGGYNGGGRRGRSSYFFVQPHRTHGVESYSIHRNQTFLHIAYLGRPATRGECRRLRLNYTHENGAFCTFLLSRVPGPRPHVPTHLLTNTAVSPTTAYRTAPNARAISNGVFAQDAFRALRTAAGTEVRSTCGGSVHGPSGNTADIQLNMSYIQ